MSEKEIVRRKLADLKPHPQNKYIYGQDEDVSDLVEQIKETRRIDMLYITPDGTILAGHRRQIAGPLAGIEEADCEILRFDSPEDEFRFLLSNNATRPKTREQKTREGMAWEQILAQDAKKRSLANLRNKKQKVGDDEGQNSAHQEEEGGKTRDKVAKLSGLGSGDTYRKCKKIAQAIDSYLEAGNTFEVQKLREAFEQSVEAAYKLLEGFKEAQKPTRLDASRNYVYRGAEQLIGIKKNLVPGARVLLASTIVPSNPDRVYIRLVTQPTETFCIAKWDIQVEIDTRQGMWRSKESLMLLTEEPYAELAEKFIRVDGLEVEAQIAYSIASESALIQKRGELKGKLESAAKKDKSSINDQLEEVEQNLTTERALQSQLNADTCDANKIREYRQNIRLWMQSLSGRSQLLPDIERNQGDPQSMTDAEPHTPPKPITEFKEGDRVKKTDSLALGTVTNVFVRSVWVGLDDLSRAIVEDLSSLCKITIEEEWQMYQEFSRPSAGGTMFTVCFDPETPGSGLLTKFHITSEIQGASTSTHVLSDSEVQELINNGQRPVLVAQRYIEQDDEQGQTEDELTEGETGEATSLETEENPTQEGEGKTDALPQEKTGHVTYLSECRSSEDVEDFIKGYGQSKALELVAETSCIARLRIYDFYPRIYDPHIYGVTDVSFSWRADISAKDEMLLSAIDELLGQPHSECDFCTALRYKLPKKRGESIFYDASKSNFVGTKQINKLVEAYADTKIMSAIIIADISSDLFLLGYPILVLREPWGKDKIVIFCGNATFQIKKKMSNFGVMVDKV